MKKLLSILFLTTLGIQSQTKFKVSQIENPATSSLNLGAQSFSAGTSTLTSVMTSTLSGGTATNSRINYLSTTGNGTSTAIGHRFMVGNNGSITPFDIYNDGNMVLGSSIFRNYATSGANTNFLFSPPNETAQTASTEKNTFVLNANTIQFATGAKTTQRTALFSGGTLTAVGGSTITNCYNGYFKANTAGTNISISSNWALGIEGGYAQIGTSETFFVRGTGLAQSWNRNPNTGGMSATAGGYQWNHTQNAAGASDFLTLATYSSNGSSTQNNAISFNSLGNVGIGTSAVNGTALTVSGQANFQSTTNILGNATVSTPSTVTLTTPLTSGTVANLADVVFCMNFQAIAHNPSDGVTFTMTTLPLVGQSSQSNRNVIPENCEAYKYDLLAYNGTTATAETSTIQLIQASNVNTLVLQTNTANFVQNTGTISINYTAGDAVGMREIDPSWSTNPTVRVLSYTIWFRRRQ